MQHNIRKAFDYGGLGSVHWFPGHMARALKDMRTRLANVQFVIEVRDARVPVSSINFQLDRLLAARDRLIVYNKADLANPNMQSRVTSFLESRGVYDRVVFVNMNTAAGARVILKETAKMARAHGTGPVSPLDPDLLLMVVGMPNVGKSSLINALRHAGTGLGAAARVGKLPGVTRSVGNRIRVLDDPRLYVIDTPGVLLPHIADPAVGMRLALTGAVKDSQVGEERLADYLLFTLNQRRALSYVQHFGLSGPSDMIDDFLDAISARIGAQLTGGEPHRLVAARHFLRQFREGALGRFTLDDLNDYDAANAILRDRNDATSTR